LERCLSRVSLVDLILVEGLNQIVNTEQRRSVLI